MTQIKSHKERKTKKSKAKACLSAAVSTTIFTRIMSLQSAKDVWDYLKKEYAGDERIQKYEASITTLENTKDLSKITLTELLNALQAQEQRRLMRQDHAIEGAFGHPPFKCWKRPNARCSKCNQLGHETIICRFKNQKQEEDAQLANQDDEDQMFLIDSGCTNHMTFDKSLFRNLQPTEVAKVRIGNGECIEAKGKGTIAITINSGTKTIADVLYIPDIDQNLLRVFGNTCFVHIPQIKRDKLGKKAMQGIFVGYSTISKAYKVYLPQTQKISITRDVQFHEDEQWNWDETQEITVLDDQIIPPIRSLEEIYQRSNVAVCEPENYEDAQMNPTWQEAMKEEIYMIEKNNTWELVDRPADKNIIGVKWIFRTKLNADNSINNFKARLVVKGYAQV
ncbi:mitochondrial protein [Salix suchowensis]|nr:mitochondrial protein [Salix suchowensis]